MKKLGHIKETFGCEQITDYIPASQMRVFIRLGLGTRVLKVTKRKSGLTSSGLPNKCHDNVALLVKTYGGKWVKGYWVAKDNTDHVTELVWHSVWITPEGVAIDPTMCRYEMMGIKPSRDFTMFIPVQTVTEKLAVSGRDMKLTENPKEDGVKLLRGFDNYHMEEWVTIAQLSHRKVYDAEDNKHADVTHWNKAHGKKTAFTQPSTATNRVLVGEEFKHAA
ncbi:hypothetical protein N9X12_06240 [Alphaproteobacteria bacterium]|nr:hypothetical protein [Alphaproteobacteria bacterium]